MSSDAVARAAVLRAPGSVELLDLPVPALRNGQALLQVEACGLCGTDHEHYRGDLVHRGFGFPVVPGHEVVGRIVALGNRADFGGFAEGDRVAVEPAVPCGTCDGCMRGDGLCRRTFGYGNQSLDREGGLWGGFATLMVLRQGTRLSRCPEQLSAEDAVLFNPLGSAVEWVVRTAGTEVGDTVLILGAGQRGLACVVAAREAGAGTIIITGLRADARNLEVAGLFGATHRLIAEDTDVPLAVAEITAGAMADRAIDLTPHASQPVLDALDSVRPGGTVVLAGLKGTDISGFSPDTVALRALNIRGGRGGSAWSSRCAIDILEANRYPLAMLHTHSFSLDQAALALRTIAGEVPGERPIHATIVVSG